MDRSAARDFVKNLSEKLNLEKDRVKKSRIHLQDSLNIILEIFRSDKSLEIRSIRDFETNEVSCFVDIYSPDDLLNSISSAIEGSGIIHKHLRLTDYKFVMIIDLGQRLITSGNEHNLFSMEVVSKRLKTFKIKISPCDPSFCYSTYEKNYHSIKYWFHYNLNIQNGSIDMRKIDRTNRENSFSDEFGNKARILLDEIGDVEIFNLLPRKGWRKN